MRAPWRSCSWLLVALAAAACLSGRSEAGPFPRTSLLDPQAADTPEALLMAGPASAVVAVGPGGGHRFVGGRTRGWYDRARDRRFVAALRIRAQVLARRYLDYGPDLIRARINVPVVFCNPPPAVPV